MLDLFTRRNTQKLEKQVDAEREKHDAMQRHCTNHGFEDLLPKQLKEKFVYKIRPLVFAAQNGLVARMTPHGPDVSPISPRKQLRAIRKANRWVQRELNRLGIPFNPEELSETDA